MSRCRKCISFTKTYFFFCISGPTFFRLVKKKHSDFVIPYVIKDATDVFPDTNLFEQIV